MSWKTLGAAETAAEHELEAILARTPRWRGQALRYRPVSGGISNANWRIDAGGPRDYFLKAPGRGTEMFIDRVAAHEASRRAHASGFGVEAVDFLPDLGVEIFVFVEGFRASSTLDFLRPPVRRNAVRALKAFNDSAPLGLTKTIFDMIEEHEAQAREVGGSLPADQSFLMRRCAEAKAAFTASGMDLVPCMNDTLAGNFMIDAADEVMIVDFEYASNNERAYELAGWFDEMAFPRGIEREMTEAYFGHVSRQVEARINVLKGLADLKWSTWAMIQEAVSSLDFDFHKYGMWKYMRARNQFHHPDWNAWLRWL
ncbi:phosphotransferase [Ancylobacter sp.]|uniref:phosphotransferase n=1 Tax=Ancylobacter sp. TaxID=1872567 RepID=UPI003D146EED